MNKKIFLKLIILILTICTASCLLFACNETPDTPAPEPTPTPTPTPEPEFYEEKEGYAYGENIEITYHSSVTDTDRKHTSHCLQITTKTKNIPCFICFTACRAPTRAGLKCAVQNT